MTEAQIDTLLKALSRLSFLEGTILGVLQILDQEDPDLEYVRNTLRQAIKS